MKVKTLVFNTSGWPSSDVDDKIDNRINLWIRNNDDVNIKSIASANMNDNNVIYTILYEE